METTFLWLAAELDRRGVAYLHINDQATFDLLSANPLPEKLQLPQYREMGPLSLVVPQQLEPMPQSWPAVSAWATSA